MTLGFRIVELDTSRRIETRQAFTGKMACGLLVQQSECSLMIELPDDKSTACWKMNSKSKRDFSKCILVACGN